MRRTRTTMAMTAGAMLLAGALPGAASAAGMTVSGDDGNPIALGGAVSIRNMSPEVTPTFTSAEASGRDYSMGVAGPDGGAAITPVDCFTASVPANRRVGYRGNGTYKVLLITWAKTERYADRCTGASTSQVLEFTVNAGSAVGPLPSTQLLRRPPNSFTTNQFAIPVAVNPGATTTEFRYAAGGVIGPDGAISGLSEQGFVNSSTGLSNVSFSASGTYVMVSRAATNGYFSPWSPPVTVTVKSPFDFRFSAPDARGPRYRIRLTLGEKTAAGRVSFALARGKKGGRYRSIGTSRISKSGTVSRRFTQRRLGTYRLRVTFKGSATTAPGKIVQQLRFSRRGF